MNFKMPGTSNSGGANRKPLATLKLTGGWRADRHGSRNPPQFAGEPEPFCELKGEAERFWRTVVPKLVGSKIATTADSVELTRLAQLWGLYSLALESANIARLAALDKNVRMAVVQYGREFGALATRFGLNPSARESLSVPLGGEQIVRKRDRSVDIG
jgi:phage terminase small subunit